MPQGKPRDVSPNPDGQATTTGANPGSASASGVSDRPLERLLLSPLSILLGTLALFFVAETIVMLLVINPLLSDESPFVGAVIDSSIMVSLSAPFLWWFIARSNRAARAVAVSEARYRSLTENAFDLILETGADGLFSYASPNYRDVLGYSPQELLGTSIFEPMHPDDLQDVMQEFSRAMSSNTPGTATFRYRHKNGDWRWFEAVGKPFAVGHEGARAVIVSRDTTERKRAEEALQLTQFSLDRAADAVFWIGPDARFVYVNHAACRSLGYSREELLTMTVLDVDPDFSAQVWPEHWSEVKSRGSFTLESHHRTKDGRTFPVEITVNFLRFADKEYNCAFARDISERKQAEEELRGLNEELKREQHEIDDLNRSLETKVKERTQELRDRNRQLLDARSLAATDALTSLPNHRAFHERIRTEVKRAAESGSSIGLIMLDIDGFKNFNDSLGHLAGDGILRHCADVLVDELGHDCVFRYGGDEFAVILLGADDASALEAAERLRRAVEARNGSESGVTISLGAASIPHAATTAEDLIYKADAAMYQAKAAGKNRVAGSSAVAADEEAAPPRVTQAAVHRR